MKAEEDAPACLLRKGDVPQDRRQKGRPAMKSLKIADTTREERERIVEESIGNTDGLCDGCSPGLAEMYMDYIEGRKELREINMEFNARYVSGAGGPEANACGYVTGDR